MSNKPVKPAEVVVAVVQKMPDRFLLVHRKLPEGKLAWTFPSGKVESGETAEQAAVREVFEETSIRCTAHHVLGQRTHPDTGRTVSYVLCNYVSGKAQVTEPNVLDRVNWMQPAKVFSAITTDIYPAVKDRLEMARHSGSQVTKHGLR